jgi:hypothetical protein
MQAEAFGHIVERLEPSESARREEKAGYTDPDPNFTDNPRQISSPRQRRQERRKS